MKYFIVLFLMLTGCLDTDSQSPKYQAGDCVVLYDNEEFPESEIHFSFKIIKVGQTKYLHTYWYTDDSIGRLLAGSNITSSTSIWYMNKFTKVDCQELEKKYKR